MTRMKEIAQPGLGLDLRPCSSLISFVRKEHTVLLKPVGTLGNIQSVPSLSWPNHVLPRDLSKAAFNVRVNLNKLKIQLIVNFFS